MLGSVAAAAAISIGGLTMPTCVTTDSDGRLYIAEKGERRLRGGCARTGVSSFLSQTAYNPPPLSGHYTPRVTARSLPPRGRLQAEEFSW